MDEEKDEIPIWKTEVFSQQLMEQMKRSMMEGHWLPTLSKEQEEKIIDYRCADVCCVVELTNIFGNITGVNVCKIENIKEDSNIAESS